MAMWVTRRTLEGRRVSASALCIEDSQFAAECGMRSIQQHILWLVDSTERIGKDASSTHITLNGKLVGYIEVSARPPAHVMNVALRR
jgi:hypothetical protein